LGRPGCRNLVRSSPRSIMTQKAEMLCLI